MSNDKRRHAAETFLSRMGTKTDANEQNSAEADKQSFVSDNEQNSVGTEPQINNITGEHKSNNANEQGSKNAEKMRRITFNIPESLYKQLKMISVRDDITLLDIGAIMVREYVEKRKGD